MGEAIRPIDLVDEAISNARSRGLLHLQAEDHCLDGRRIQIHDEPKLHFASCSYLGLEFDPRLKRGAIDAVERYGTQFSSSRSYVSAPLYEELETLLDTLFGAHTLVTPSTTLGHLSVLPVLVEEGDAVILDHQVHQSVQMALAPVRLQGTHVEFVRHGELEHLEARIRELSASHRKIWFMADGVYSMYGDFAPVKALSWLLTQHEQLHLYIDDAHGMSWTGRNGCGFAAHHLSGHERVVITVSLNKAFAAAGGAIVFPDAEMARRVRNCGGPMIFSGPIQPPMLGAALASAKIHLSPEIDALQADLLNRIRFANRTARELDLPLVSAREVPIRYIGLGLMPAVYDMSSYLLEQGVYVNGAGFPAVGSRSGGIRFTITLHQSLEDIRRVLELVAERLPASLAAADSTRADVDRRFRLESPPRRPVARPNGHRLTCQHESTVTALDAVEWDDLLGARGCFDVESLSLLERSFGPDQTPENRWGFHYYAVRDAGGHPVLATFFTDAIWKDDLLASAKVSEAVEERRQSDPYFLTSRSLAMGSLLTEGDHLHLDRRGDWRGALSLLLSALEETQEKCDASTLVVRDMPAEDVELAEFFTERGFLRIPLPGSQVIDVDWSSREEFLAARTKRERRFHREQVEPWADAYELEILSSDGRRPSDAEWRHLHALYQNVQRRNLALNTFPLPEAVFRCMLETHGWEILLLRLRAERGGRDDDFAQGFMAARAGGTTYVPLVAGMDYAYVESHSLYRQLISQTVQRAHALGVERIAFGMGAELEKRRFGARSVERVIYVRSDDHFHHDVLELIASNPELQRKS